MALEKAVKGRTKSHTTRLGKTFHNRRGSDMMNFLGEDRFGTTNKEFYQGRQSGESIIIYRKNFKKKTPFTQWSNAYFGNGVFFNPPVQGI